MIAQTSGEAGSPRTAFESQLILWWEEGLDGEPVAELLRAVRELDTRTDLPAATEIGTGTETPGMLLLCRAPVDNLCRAMLQDIEPSVAIEAWRQQSWAILALSRRNRRKVRILFSAAIARDPKAFLRLYGLPETEAVIARLAGLAEPAPDGILRLLAERSLLGHVEVRALVSEMMALAPDLSGAGGMQGDPDAAFRGLLEQRAQLEVLNREMAGADAALREARRSLDQARKESDLLRAQQQVMHEQMEALYAEKLQAEQRIEQMGGGLESYRIQLEAQQSRLDGALARMADKEKVLAAAGAMMRYTEALADRRADDLSREAERRRALEAEASRLEETLAQEADRCRSLEADTARLEETLTQETERRHSLEAEIDRVLNSRSYRFSAPLRWVRATLTGRKQGQ